MSTCGVLGAVQESPKFWESAFVAGAGYSVMANNLIDKIRPEFSVRLLKKKQTVTTICVNLFTAFKEARKGFFGCYSVCETMKDNKEG